VISLCLREEEEEEEEYDTPSTIKTVG